MIRHAVVVVLFSALALAQQAPAAGSPVEQARRVVDLLLQGKYAEVVAMFAPEVKKALPEEKLRTNVQPVFQSIGAVRQRLEPRTQTAGEQQTVILPVQFEKVTLEFVVSSNKAGEIIGLWMRPALAVEANTFEKQKVLSRDANRAVFAYGIDEVWPALMEALTELQVSPKSTDKASGTVFLETDAQWGSYWGDANTAVARVSTKKVESRSTWVAIAARGNIFCRAAGRGTELRVNFQFSGCNGWSAMGTGPCRWEPLDSSGFVEGLLLDQVARRLPDKEPTPDKVSPQAVDQKLVQAARELLVSVQKVDSSIKLSAGREASMSRMIDAMALLDALDGSARGALLPSFAKYIREAIELYGKAIEDTADNGRILGEARELVAKATARLDHYESDAGPDPSPARTIHIDPRQ